MLLYIALLYTKKHKTVFFVNMGSFLGSAEFSAAVFFYCLGLIFGVVGFIGPWLVPRAKGDSSGISNIGIRKACFKEYDGFGQFFREDERDKTIDGCVDTTRSGKQLSEIPSEYVRPGMYTPD